MSVPFLDRAMRPPLVTPGLAGTGGRIKAEPEDFEVEEIPAYEPCGEGDHLFLWVRKRDVGAEYFQRQVAKRLGVAAGDVGTAGLKDRRAVTRQWVSVPAAAEPRLGELDGDGIELLRVTRHTNKLKSGHLNGNRFRVRIRDAAAGAEDMAAAVVSELRAVGLPNFFGPQRFGKDGETAGLGFDVLTAGRKLKSPFLRKLALSAAQSVLFNAQLAGRIDDGLYRTVLAGDVMRKWPAGGMFVATDVAAEQARFDARETVTAGPIFGPKMFAPAGVAAEREAELLASAGLDSATFSGFGKLVQGTRRMDQVYVDGAAVEPAEGGLWLTFTLPAGSYATVLLREVTKADDPDEPE